MTINLSDQQIINGLTELKIINKNLLDEAIKTASNKNVPLTEVLINKDLISDENLGKIMADLIGFPFVQLSSTPINHEIFTLIPEIVAKKQQMFAFKKDGHGLHLAMSNPGNLEVTDFVAKKVGIPVISYYATNRDLAWALNLYKKNITEAFDDIIKDNISKAKKQTLSDPPIIKIIDTIITYGQQNHASDIHIEPTRDHSLVRFRIDGILHDVIKLPNEIHPLVVTRIKVLSKLRTDEHQTPQDGKLQFNLDPKKPTEYIDIRVSIVPIVVGEKIVMRLLSASSRQYSLVDLGITNTDLTKVENAYQKPYGMILSTGPTGSGKTTTMYAIIKLLNKSDRNIMTIEDPVEYDIEGINQIQVNNKANLTFASGLRSILRQDPNIILVGEIRDNDTASIAINASLTGHLVLSTLHTNNASTALPRLSDMGIEPYLVASTVNVIIAQRLLRKICTNCRVSQEKTQSDIKKLLPFALPKSFIGTKKSVRVYYGKGCSICHDTGYEGRVGIFEVMEMTDKLRAAIVAKKDATEIERIAVDQGMTTMLIDGLNKVKQGITTIEEVIRVIK